MASLRELLTELNDSGLNDAAIAREIVSSGIETTQATINRLKNGIHKTAKFELGHAILALHRQHCRKSA
jgi:hypothetical protein